MRRIILAISIISIAILGLFGSRGLLMASSMDHSQMMEHSGCLDGDCGEPTSAGCISHCLAQALDQAVEIVLPPSFILALAAGVALAIIIRARPNRIWQPIALIRSPDPAWILSTMRRE